MAHNTRHRGMQPGKDIFRELSDLLRENGEKILSGQSKLSLTTNCLYTLNDNFAHISEDDFTTSFEVLPPNTPKLPQYYDLQFLYDIVQKTVALKLLQGNCTLQGRVNLAAFKSLQSLELKKTPLNMLEGINKLRRKLSILICTRCLRQLQDLIETCGGDMSTPMSWQNLHTASFSYNALSELDSSLRLLPALEVLDLSHNSIKTTENYFEYLTEIQVVSLGFNQLEVIPSFSLSGRTKLQILILRNNNLDSLVGLEELVALRELDLANNCLCDHRDLEPVSAISKLTKLFLDGNPLCYHPQHRTKTLEQVHPLCLGRLTLDNKAVTAQEVMYCRRYHNLTNDSWLNISVTPHSSVRHLPHVSSASSFEFERSYESPSTSTTQDEIGVGTRPHNRGSAKVNKTGMQKVRRKSASKKGTRRVRRPNISDISDGDDTFADNSSEASFSSTPHDDSHMEIKQTLEAARDQLGPDWLQYLVHNKAVLPNQRREELGREAEQVNAMLKATEDDIYLNAEEYVINSESQDLQVKDDGDDEKVVRQVSSSPTERSNTMNGSCKQLSQDDLTQNTNRARHESRESDTIINWKPSSTEQETDYGVESEPFIVFNPNDENQSQMIITVTERYLIEKDINGDVMETLDLRCLQKIENREEMISTASMEGVHVEVHVIRLMFDYVRKDKRDRAYVMEDTENAKDLQEILKPALEENLCVSKLKSTMHCLKCGRDFSKSEAEIKIQRNAALSGNDKDDLEEVALCPHCGGNMIIQVDNQQLHVTGGGSNFATPVGSYSASLTMPPAPWKHSTPAKLIKADESSLASASFKSITDSLPVDTFGASRSLREQESTVYKSQLTETASFDVLDSSCTGEEKFGQAVTTGTEGDMNVGATESTGPSAVCTVGDAKENARVSGETSASRNLFSSEQSRINTRVSNANHVSSPRKRQDSSGSDIVVLKRHSQADSDITLISNPSQSSIAILESESIYGSQGAKGNSNWDSNCTGPVTFTISEDDLPLNNGATAVSEGTGQLQTVMETSSAGDSDLSPMGSLTKGTLHSMVNSMYEKSLPSDDKSSDNSSSEDSPKKQRSTGISHVSSSESFQSFTGDATAESHKVNILNPTKNRHLMPDVQRDSSPSIYSTTPTWSIGSGSGAEESNKLYKHDNYNYIDHRLKLYLMMNVFSQDVEEFSVILKCGCVQFNKGEEFPCFLILSSSNIYVIKITGDESGTQFEKWLKLVQCHPINRLKYVDIGLGHQSFHVEFTADNSSFTFLIRDERRCKAFLRQFTKLVTSQNSSSQSHLEGISKHNPTTQTNLESQILHSDQVEDEIDETILKFCQGYLHTGQVETKGEKSLSPVSFVVTPSHVFLINEDYNWPAPRSVAVKTLGAKRAQFQLQDHQRINDITAIDLYPVAPREMCVKFLDEETNEECSWHVAMETDDALLSLVGVIRQPWESQFGVDLQVNIVQSEDSGC